MKVEKKRKKTIEARSFYRTNLYIHMNKLKLRKKRENRLNLIVSFNLIRKLLELLNQNNKK